MNIFALKDFTISGEMLSDLTPIAIEAIKSGQLTTKEGVALFHAKIGRQPEADAAVIVANHMARTGLRYGLESIVPIREWADRYAAHLLDWSGARTT